MSQSPPQEAGVLREQLEQAIEPYTFAKDGLVNEILEIFSAAVDGLAPETIDGRYSAQIQNGWLMAVEEFQRRRKVAGL